MKISKQWKNGLETSFYTSASVLKIMIICYTVPQIWHVSDVIIIFCFRQFLALLLPPPSRPPKISQKWKKHLKVSAFTTSVLKIMIICFIVPEIWHLMDVVVSFNFGLFFAILPHLTAQKMKKHTWRYHNFTQLYQKSWSYAILFLRYGLLGIELSWYVTDGLMDRWTEKVTYRGGCPT